MISNMIQHYNYTRTLKTIKIGAYLGRSSGQQTYSIGAFCYYPAKGVPFAVSWVEDFVVLLMLRISLSFLGLRDSLPFLLRDSLPFLPTLLPACCWHALLYSTSAPARSSPFLPPGPPHEPVLVVVVGIRILAGSGHFWSDKLS